MNLYNNLELIRENITKAAKRSGRSDNNIKLIAVTKTVDVNLINQSIKLGIKNIGENRVQEVEKKYESIVKGINWHMIGHLQSNKVKYIIDKVHLIHSLDRISLANEIQKRAEQNDIIIDVLIQVNIAEEESKFGLKREKVIPFIEKLLEFSNINIKGLMTIAPYVENSEEIRPVFRDLKKLSIEILEKKYSNVDMKYLSMGMTNDYEVAIEEGSNMVRIGSGIFGRREY